MYSKEEFEKLSATNIKKLLAEEVPLEYILWAQEDCRKSVQQLANTYVRKQRNMLIEKKRLDEMYFYEKEFYDSGKYLVCGVDEVGRGPIAGPVTVAAVILPPLLFIDGLNDSKKLSEKKREEIYNIIIDKAISISCISLSVEDIDRLNIYQATKMGMIEAVKNLDIQPEAVLIDAMPIKELAIPTKSIIKGDSKSASIAAASVVAKVVRDKYMKELNDKYPGYGFAKNKGYCTTEHREALENLGITPEHRRSFEPVTSIVNKK